MEEIDVVTTMTGGARPRGATTDAQLKAVLEAIVYVTDEPLSAQQIAAALEQPLDRSSGCWMNWWRITRSPSTA